MSGLVERRNHPFYWSGSISWLRLTTKSLPACDDCLIEIHENSAAGYRPNRAVWRRRNTPRGVPLVPCIDVTTVLCQRHADAWKVWSRGQTEMAL
jgi:hypothetical protein